MENLICECGKPARRFHTGARYVLDDAKNYAVACEEHEAIICANMAEDLAVIHRMVHGEPEIIGGELPPF